MADGAGAGRRGLGPLGLASCGREVSAQAHRRPRALKSAQQAGALPFPRTGPSGEPDAGLAGPAWRSG